MKSFSILLILMFSISGLALAQEDQLDFVSKKPLGDNSVIYFDVAGIHNSDHANSVLEMFIDDPNIFDGRYFVSSAYKDRFQLTANSNVTATYILNLLESQGCDYDYSSIIRNGVIPRESNTSNPSSNATRTPVNYPGFPQYINTGNQLDDAKRYSEEKNKWINEHPQEYEQMIQGIENK